MWSSDSHENRDAKRRLTSEVHAQPSLCSLKTWAEKNSLDGWVCCFNCSLSLPGPLYPHLQVCFSFACIGSSHVARLLIGIPSRARSRPRKAQEAPAQEAPACTILKQPCLYTTHPNIQNANTSRKGRDRASPIFVLQCFVFSSKNKIDFFFFFLEESGRQLLSVIPIDPWHDCQHRGRRSLCHSVLGALQWFPVAYRLTNPLEWLLILIQLPHITSVKKKNVLFTKALAQEIEKLHASSLPLTSWSRWSAWTQKESFPKSPDLYWTKPEVSFLSPLCRDQWTHSILPRVPAFHGQLA